MQQKNYSRVVNGRTSSRPNLKASSLKRDLKSEPASKNPEVKFDLKSVNGDFSHAVKLKLLTADQMSFINSCVVTIVLWYLKQSRHLGLQSYYMKITDAFLC